MKLKLKNLLKKFVSIDLKKDLVLSFI